MNIISNWKLTYDPAGTPLVLLDFGMEMQEEPEFNLSRGLEVVNIAYGTPFLRPTAADVYQVSLSIVRYSSTDALARRDMINQLTDRYDQTTRKPMRLEIQDQTDRYYQWSDAFVTAAGVRRLSSDGGDGEAAWLLRFGFTAVNFTKTIL